MDDEDISQRLASQADAEILKLLGMDYELFTSTITVLQGLPSNFSTMMPTVRKQMIENMLGFSLWDEIKSLLEVFTKKTNNERNTVSDKFTKEREKLIGMNSRLQALKEMGETQQQKVLDEIKQVRSELKPVLNKLKELESARAVISSSLSEVKQNISSLDFEYDGFVRRAKDLKTILKQKICPTCKQDFPSSMIQESEDELNKISVDTEKISTDKDAWVKLRDQIESIEQEKRFVEQSKTSFEKQLVKLAALMDTDAAGELSTLTKTVESLTESVNIIKSELDAVDKDLEYLKYLDALLKPSSKFRGQILERYLTYVNTILNRISPMILGKVGVNLVMADKKGVGVELVVTKEGKQVSYKSRSGGEKRRIDIVLILGFQKFLLDLHNISTNLLFFDEIMDPLDKKGVESVLYCLDSLFPQDMAIYIITHNESSKDLFDNILTVIKENDISRIE
jgi:DNA repair exonuclease SbcCD ATPase subunit